MRLANFRPVGKDAIMDLDRVAFMEHDEADRTLKVILVDNGSAIPYIFQHVQTKEWEAVKAMLSPEVAHA